MEKLDKELSATVPLVGAMQGQIDTLDKQEGQLEVDLATLKEGITKFDDLQEKMEKETRRLVDLYFKQIQATNPAGGGGMSEEVAAELQAQMQQGLESGAEALALALMQQGLKIDAEAKLEG